MAHNFQSAILRVVVGQICEAVGYNSITQPSLEILVDLLKDFIVRLGGFSAQLCNINSRVEPTFFDVLRTLDYFGVSIDELQDHIANVEIPPIPLKIHPNNEIKGVNRIQRHLLIDDLLEATKNKANAPDSATIDTGEADQQNSTPSAALLRDMFADVLNEFKDVAPVSADKTIRPPSPRSVSTVIKIKKTTSPLPDEVKISHLHQSAISRPKTLAERKALPLDLDAKSYLKISRRQMGEKKRGRKSLKETKERERDDLRALKKKMASKTVMKAVKLSKKEKRSKDKSKKIKKSSLNLSPRHSPLATTDAVKIPKKRGRKSNKDKLLANESVTPQKKVGRVKSNKKLRIDKKNKKPKDKIKVKLDKEQFKSENKADDEFIANPQSDIPLLGLGQSLDAPKKIEKKRGRKSKKDKELEALALVEQQALLINNESESENQKAFELEQERRRETEREELEKAKMEEDKERQRREEREKEMERERERERQRKQLDWEREQQEKEREKQKEIEAEKEREKEKEKEREKEREKDREKIKTKDKIRERDTGLSIEPSKKKKKTGKAGRKKKNQCIIITETVDTEDVTRIDEKEWICPGCGNADDGSLMLECEDCKNWYHFSCTTLTKEPAEDEDWFCDLCLNRSKQLREVKHTKDIKIPKEVKILKEAKERIKEPKPSTSKVPTVIQEPAETDDVPCPVCDKPYDGSLMLQCEDPDCAKWFHGSCVNIYVEPSESDPWFCKKCIEKQLLYLNTAYDKRKRRK